MKKQSLRSRIAQRLKEVGGWVHKGKIEERAKEWGYLADGATRRCREMVSGRLSNGKTCPILLEEKKENGSTLYRYKQKKVLRSQYVEREGRMVEVKQMIFQ